MVMAVVAVTTMAVRFAGEIARLRMDIRLGERTYAALLDRVLRLPSRFFGTSTVGELAARIAAVTGVPTGLRQLLIGGAMSGALMLGSLAVLAVFDFLAAGVGLVMLVIQLTAAAVAAWL